MARKAREEAREKRRKEIQKKEEDERRARDKIRADRMRVSRKMHSTNVIILSYNCIEIEGAQNESQ